MNAIKTIGIIGGMGPMAGVELHKRLILQNNSTKDQHHLSIVHASFPSKIVDRSEFLENKIEENPGHEILNEISSLVSVGASVFGIACNTAHSPLIFDVVKSGINGDTSIKLLSIVEETKNYCLKTISPNSKIGILASNGVYKSKVYVSHLEDNFEVISPMYDFQNNFIHRMIYDVEFGLKSNNDTIRAEVYDLLHQVMKFFEEKNVDVILIGCTEFSLLKEYIASEYAHLTTIDTMDILCKALIREVRKN
nr:aspartate racemase [Tenacibaculum mesophilum]